MLAAITMPTVHQHSQHLIFPVTISNLDAHATLEGPLWGHQVFKQIWDYDQCWGVKNLSLPGGHDPKMVLPFTIEVPHLDAKLWQSKLEAMWGSKKRKHTRNPAEQDEPEVDMVAEGMKVSEGMYESCKDSFITADEHWEKALKRYFEDTGMMASVCCHGVPLFCVSLCTPGEQQFYTFALLSKVLEHLPSSWKVGCLYDIGCQIHHAVHKCHDPFTATVHGRPTSAHGPFPRARTFFPIRD